jgi:hypothetical protein
MSFNILSSFEAQFKICIRPISIPDLVVCSLHLTRPFLPFGFWKYSRSTLRETAIAILSKKKQVGLFKDALEVEAYLARFMQELLSICTISNRTDT